MIKVLALVMAIVFVPPAWGKKSEASDTYLEVELVGGETPVAKSMREAAKILWILEETE